MEIGCNNIVFTLLALTVIIYLVRYYAVGIVVGYSMRPCFTDGDLFIVKKRGFKLQEGKVYMLRKDGIFVVKRLNSISNKGLYFLGDNAADSMDSRYYGYLDVSAVAGEVTKIGGFSKCRKIT